MIATDFSVMGKASREVRWDKSHRYTFRICREWEKDIRAEWHRPVGKRLRVRALTQIPAPENEAYQAHATVEKSSEVCLQINS